MAARRHYLIFNLLFSGGILTSVGQSTLPASCPVCEHNPLSAEDCKPNKPLRTTITVFLRTEKKKRELVIEQAESPRSSTPVAPPSLNAPPATQNISTTSSLQEHDSQQDGQKDASNASEDRRQPQLEDKGSQNYSPALSNELADGTSGLALPGKTLDGENAEKAVESERQGSEMGGQHAVGQEDLKVGIEGQLGQWGAGQGQQQMMSAVGAGFNGSGVGFPNMSWNGPGDFNNPIVNGMQAVMPNAGWGSFPNAMGKISPI
ncbi:hypothetical protein GP486_004546 [Trichoglossum hirsutum]|uniref:Uncharacterized protein n=1 Tax=Trichoglossum hirsutum TaxID=265104 RepID=A0A9P8RNX9_9PEZI|nr:hypothetical protein GP486_004546 [Trichoglossum hirsutum]